jgi:hypothetical protein
MRRPPTRPQGLAYTRLRLRSGGQSPVNGAEKKPSTAKMGRLVARVSPTFAIPRSLLGVPCFPSGAQGPALRKHVLLTFAAPPACFREQHAEAWHRRMETCHRPQARRAGSVWPGVTERNPRNRTPNKRSPKGATERNPDHVSILLSPLWGCVRKGPLTGGSLRSHPGQMLSTLRAYSAFC